MTFILIRLFSMLDFFALAICSALESNVLGNLAGEERGTKNSLSWMVRTMPT